LLRPGRILAGKVEEFGVAEVSRMARIARMEAEICTPTRGHGFKSWSRHTEVLRLEGEHLELAVSEASVGVERMPNRAIYSLFWHTLAGSTDPA